MLTCIVFLDLILHRGGGHQWFFIWGTNTPPHAQPFTLFTFRGSAFIRRPKIFSRLDTNAGISEVWKSLLEATWREVGQEKENKSSTSPITACLWRRGVFYTLVVKQNLKPQWKTKKKQRRRNDRNDRSFKYFSVHIICIFKCLLPCLTFLTKIGKAFSYLSVGRWLFKNTQEHKDFNFIGKIKRNVDCKGTFKKSIRCIFLKHLKKYTGS